VATVRIIYPDGEGEDEVISYDKNPEYSEMKDWIENGWMEHIRVIWEGRECDAIIDEEGKIKGLKMNAMATAAYIRMYPDINDVIVGPCAICTDFELE